VRRRVQLSYTRWGVQPQRQVPWPGLPWPALACVPLPKRHAIRRLCAWLLRGQADPTPHPHEPFLSPEPHGSAFGQPALGQPGAEDPCRLWHTLVCHTPGLIGLIEGRTDCVAPRVRHTPVCQKLPDEPQGLDGPGPQAFSGRWGHEWRGLLQPNIRPDRPLTPGGPSETERGADGPKALQTAGGPPLGLTPADIGLIEDLRAFLLAGLPDTLSGDKAGNLGLLLPPCRFRHGLDGQSRGSGVPQTHPQSALYQHSCHEGQTRLNPMNFKGL